MQAKQKNVRKNASNTLDWACRILQGLTAETAVNIPVHAPISQSKPPQDASSKYTSDPGSAHGIRWG
jgi:hypothetical protein